MFLIAEVFHCFEIEQAVDGLGIRIRVGVIHVAADVDAPFGGEVGEAQVTGDGGQNRCGIEPAEGPGEDAGDQANFKGGWKCVEQREAQNCINAGGAA